MNATPDLPMLRKAAPLLMCALLQSCGTILNGPPYMVPVDSNPRGATVFYREAAVGTTPCQVAMDGNCLELLVQKSGHGSQQVTVDYGFNWIGMVGNALLGIPGLAIGIPVDHIQGAWRVPSSDGVRVVFASTAGPSPTLGRVIRSADPNISPICIVEPCRNAKLPGYTVCQRHRNEAAERGQPIEQYRAPAPSVAPAAPPAEAASVSDFCARAGCRHLHAYGYILCDTHLAEARAAGTPEEPLRAPNQ